MVESFVVLNSSRKYQNALDIFCVLVYAKLSREMSLLLRKAGLLGKWQIPDLGHKMCKNEHGIY